MRSGGVTEITIIKTAVGERGQTSPFRQQPLRSIKIPVKRRWSIAASLFLVAFRRPADCHHHVLFLYQNERRNSRHRSERYPLKSRAARTEGPPTWITKD